MAGENQVIFRKNQQYVTDDLNNIENYTSQTFIDLIADAIDPGQKYAGLNVTQNGPTGISVGTGRYYAGGQIYVNTSSVALSVQAQLPVVTQKIATLVAWGVNTQVNPQPRAYLINANPQPGQSQPFQPQIVTVQSQWQVQLNLVYGAESAAPARGSISSGVIPVCDILLSPSGIVSIAMDPTYELGSVAASTSALALIAAWQTKVSQQINTLLTDYSILASQIPANLQGTLSALASQIQTILNRLAQISSSSAPFWTGVNRFVNTADANTGASGYAASIQDGLRFPKGASSQTGISLLNPLDAGVMTTGNVTLPAYDNVLRYGVIPVAAIVKQVSLTGFPSIAAVYAAYPTAFNITATTQNQGTLYSFSYYAALVPAGAFSVFVSAFPVVTLNWTLKYLARTVVRYGDRFTSAIAAQPLTSLLAIANAASAVANQSSAAGLAEAARRPDLAYYQCNRAGGEPYTLSWLTFWQEDNPNFLVSERENGCWIDYYDDPYWNAVTSNGSYSGSTLSHVFLNQTNGWMTQLRLFPASIGPSGDVQIHICELDASGAPDHTNVLSHTTVPVASLAGGLTGTLVNLTPVYLKGGTKYAIIIHTPGNHSFFCVGATELAAYGAVPGVIYYHDGTRWVIAQTQTPLFLQFYFAQFRQTQYALQLAAASLAGGISSARITASAHIPAGTSLSWQAQISGEWIPLDPDNITAFASNPALVPLRVLFTGTGDVMPGIDLTQAELDVYSTATSLDYFSAARTLGASTTSIKIDGIIENWDAAHDTYAAKVHVGDTTYTASTTVDTPDPQVPTTIRREWSFTVASTSIFSYELIATATAGQGYPVMTACFDFAY
jgi:hypothetical protein